MNHLPAPFFAHDFHLSNYPAEMPDSSISSYSQGAEYCTSTASPITTDHLIGSRRCGTHPEIPNLRDHFHPFRRWLLKIISNIVPSSRGLDRTHFKIRLVKLIEGYLLNIRKQCGEGMEVTVNPYVPQRARGTTHRTANRGERTWHPNRKQCVRNVLT